MATEITGQKADGFAVKPYRWPAFFTGQIILRFLAVVFAAIALAMMTSSTQSVVFFGIKFVAKFKYSAAFRFKVGADAVVCGLTLLSLILVYMLSHPKTKPHNYFYFLLHDMVMMVLVMAGSAAAAAVGYIGKHGQDETGWIAICDRVGKFCQKVSVSIAFSFLAFLCLFVLSIMSAYKLKLHTVE